jgi:hypothetical protein
MLPLLSIGYSVKTRRQSLWIPSFGQSIEVTAPILPLAEQPMPLAIGRQRRRFNRRGVWSISRRPTIRGRPVRPQGAVTALPPIGSAGPITWGLVGVDERRQCPRDHPDRTGLSPSNMRPPGPGIHTSPQPSLCTETMRMSSKGLKQHRAREARAEAGAVEPSPRSIKVIHN